jgi:hypothetical protein
VSTPEDPRLDGSEGVPSDPGPRNPTPGREQTALAAEVRRIREKVDQTAELHTALAATVSEQLAPELGALRQATVDELASLRGDLNEVLETLNRENNPPVDWFHLTAEQAEEQWPILAQWVGEVFVPWYRITRDQLPDCWALHPNALVELSWLRSAHVQSYIPSSHPHIAAEWHARWKTAALDNIRAAIPTDMCRPGEHLVSEQESRERVTQSNPPPAPPVPGEQPWNRPPASPPAGHNWDGVIRTARRQLAEPRHWWGFYEQAVQEDLQWRRTREQQTSTAPTPPAAAPLQPS